MRAIDYGIQHFGHYSYSNNKSNIYVFNEDARLDDDSNEFKNETEEIDNNVYYREIEFTNNEQTKFLYVLDGEILSEDTINYIKLSGITPYLEKNFEYNDEYDPNNEFNYLNTKIIEFENKTFLKLNKGLIPGDNTDVYGQSKKKKDKPLFLLNEDLNRKNNSVIVFISDDGSKLERAYQNIECYQNEVILFLESDFGSNIFGSLLRVKTGNNVTDANQIPAKAIAKVINAFKLNIDIDVATLTKAIKTQISSKSGLMHFVKQRFILTDRLISIPVNFTFDAVIGYMNTVSEGVEEHLKFKEHRWQYYNSDGTINPDANLLFFDPSVFDNLEEKEKRKEGKNIIKRALDEVDLFEAALFQKIEQSKQKTEFNEFNEYVIKALKKTSKILKTLKGYIRNPELLAIAITKNTLIALNAFLVGLLNSIFDVFKSIFDIISLLCQGLKAVREKGISLIANWSSYLGFFIETLENIIDTVINLFSTENLKAFFEFLIKTQKFLFELPVYLTKLAIDNETVVTADRIGYYTGYIIGMFIDVVLGAIATGGIKTTADVFRVIAKQLQDLFRLGKKVLEKSFTFAGNVIESFVAVVTAIRKGAKNIKPFLDEVLEFLRKFFDDIRKEIKNDKGGAYGSSVVATNDPEKVKSFVEGFKKLSSIKIIKPLTHIKEAMPYFNHKAIGEVVVPIDFTNCGNTVEVVVEFLRTGKLRLAESSGMQRLEEVAAKFGGGSFQPSTIPRMKELIKDGDIVIVYGIKHKNKITGSTEGHYFVGMKDKSKFHLIDGQTGEQVIFSQTKEYGDFIKRGYLEFKYLKVK
jgi:hypothetical protein